MLNNWNSILSFERSKRIQNMTTSLKDIQFLGSMVTCFKGMQSSIIVEDYVEYDYHSTYSTIH